VSTSQTKSRPVSRPTEFAFHFSAAYMRIRGGYDMQNEKQFEIITKNAYRNSEKLPTEDFGPFMANISQKELQDPYAWRVALSNYIADKYPTPLKKEEPVIEASEFGKAIARALRISFGASIDQKLRPLLKSICEYRAYKNTGRLKILNKKHIFRIRNASYADKRKVIKAIKLYEKGYLNRRQLEYIRSERKINEMEKS